MCLCLVFGFSAMLFVGTAAEEGDAWDGKAASAFDGGTGTKADPYNDLSDTQTEEYAYAVTIDGITKYSCYTDAQRAVLERYMQRRETV